MSEDAKPRERNAKRHWAPNLEHRLEALSDALKTCEADPGGVAAARRLVASIRASSELHGMTPVAKAARRAEDAPPAEFVLRLRELITALQAEIARRGKSVQTVLVVSADTELIRALTVAFQARARQVRSVATSTQALQALMAHDAAFAVIDLVFAGQDGRALIAAIRSLPSTSALPIVAIGPKLATSIKDGSLVQEADGYFEKPVKPDDVADFLTLRLKRGHERGRDARRDPLTGLLNRAAFCQTYFDLMAQRPDPDEPLAVAMLGVNRFEALADTCGPVARDEVIRHLAFVLSTAFRSTDIVARWGVSEFVVLMPGEDHYGSTRAIEKALGLLTGRTATTPTGKVLPVTVCAGIAVATGNPPMEATVERAERFLRAACDTDATTEGALPVVSDATKAAVRTRHMALCVADPKVASLIGQLLESDNVEPHALPSVDAALDALSRQTMDVLVIDDALPDDGAIRLLRAARALPSRARIPLLMLVADETSVVRALEEGAGDYAVKPLEPAAFVARIHRMFRRGDRTRDRQLTTILVVDHEVPQLLVAGTTLHQQGGCRIMLARGARDALRRIAETPPDLVILDMQMPDVSGSDFLKAIPPMPGHRTMDVIPAADAAHADVPLASNVFRIRGRLTRPYRPGTFIEQVRAWVSLPAPGADAGTLDTDALDTEIQRVLTLRT